MPRYRRVGQSEIVPIRVEPEELEMIKTYAERDQMSRSAIVRRLMALGANAANGHESLDAALDAAGVVLPKVPFRRDDGEMIYRDSWTVPRRDLEGRKGPRMPRLLAMSEDVIRAREEMRARIAAMRGEAG